jgi:hypothetical protein
MIFVSKDFMIDDVFRDIYVLDMTIKDFGLISEANA